MVTVSPCRYSSDERSCIISPIWILQFHRKLIYSCCYFVYPKTLPAITAPDGLLIKEVSLCLHLGLAAEDLVQCEGVDAKPEKVKPTDVTKVVSLHPLRPTSSCRKLTSSLSLPDNLFPDLLKQRVGADYIIRVPAPDLRKCNCCCCWKERPTSPVHWRSRRNYEELQEPCGQ